MGSSLGVGIEPERGSKPADLGECTFVFVPGRLKESDIFLRDMVAATMVC